LRSFDECLSYFEHGLNQLAWCASPGLGFVMSIVRVAVSEASSQYFPIRECFPKTSSGVSYRFTLVGLGCRGFLSLNFRCGGVLLNVAEEKTQRVLIAATRSCRFANSVPSDEGNWSAALLTFQ